MIDTDFGGIVHYQEEDLEDETTVPDLRSNEKFSQMVQNRYLRSLGPRGRYTSLDHLTKSLGAGKYKLNYE